MTDENNGKGFFSKKTRVVAKSSKTVVGKTVEIKPEAQPQDQAPQRPQGSAPAAKGGATRLVGPRGGSSANTAKETSQQEVEHVVGWLVILEGPGKGRSVQLGYGLNSIGRGIDQRVRLDFGDSQISRSTHCSIAYDLKNRKFFLQHGEAQNLTYLADQPVLSPVELTDKAIISLGGTTLQFIALCGADFDWQDTEKQDQG